MELFNAYVRFTVDKGSFESDVKGATDTARDAADSMGTASIAVGNIIADVIQKGASALVDLGKKGVQYNAQIETYTQAITTALGGTAEAAQNAADAIEKIKQDAASTPFSVDGLVQANMYLMTAGESADEARKNIMALSEAVSASGGSNVELQRMAQNLQQIKNTGKATAQDIKQFANAGINVYGLLADYTGLAVEETKDLEVSYEMLTGALQMAAAEGGRFYGANIAQSQTMNGMISTLSDNISQKLGEAFADVTDGLKEIIPVANEFVKSLDMDEVLEAFGNIVTGVAVVVGSFEAQRAYKAIIANFVVPIQTAQVQLALYNMEVGETAAKEALLSGEMGLTGTIAAVMSGQLTLAEAAQLGLNAAVSAFPLMFLVTAFVMAGKSAQSMISDFNDAVAGMSDVGDSSEEVRAQIEALEQQLEDLGANGVDFFVTASEEEQREAIATKQAINELKDKLIELEAAEEAAGDGAGSAADGFRESGDVAIQVSEEVQTLAEAYADTYDKISNSVDKAIGTFEAAPEKQKASVDSMIANLQTQEAYNNSFAQSIETIANSEIEGISELAQTFTDATPESAAYAEAIAQAIEAGGGEKVQKLVEAWNRNQEAQERLTEALASTTQAFDDLVEAAEGDIDTINAALDGLDGKVVTIYYEGVMTGQHASGGLGSGTAWGTNGRHAVGLDYVPFDGYIAELHKGERVLNASEARDYASSGSSSKAVAQEVTIPMTLEIDGTILAKKLYKHSLNENDFHGSSLINTSGTVRKLGNM